MFEFDGVDLEFEDAALEAIAQEAIEKNTGARGLRAILETMMLILCTIFHLRMILCPAPLQRVR